MKTLHFIGAGKLGSTLASALATAGYPISTRWTITEFNRFLNNEIELNIQPQNILFITVPDDQISSVVHHLATKKSNWQDIYIFHCSGLLSHSILNELDILGAKTAALHPLQSFNSPNMPAAIFSGIFFSFEGGPQLFLTAKSIVADLGANIFKISASGKLFFHLAAVFGSNFLPVLLEISREIYDQSGDKIPAFREMFEPIIKNTLNNYFNTDDKIKLSGPHSRGDVTTIQKHLEILKTQNPDFNEVYRLFSKHLISHLADLPKDTQSELFKRLGIND